MIDAGEFLIGRQPDSNLCLESRSVSRRHCVVVQREERVLIIDLGSRNPTIVNGIPLAKHKPQPLYDGDKIQIGRIKFLIAMRNERTGDVVNRLAEALQAPDGDSPTGALLNELSEIALNFGDNSDNTAITRTFVLGSDHSGESKTFDSEIDSVFGSTVEISTSDTRQADEPEPVEQPSSAAKQPKVKETKEETEHDETETETNGPRKLPSHLRPKGPADSQGAAEQALRNMFNRR